jgi:hypothetical protein
MAGHRPSRLELFLADRDPLPGETYRDSPFIIALHGMPAARRRWRSYVRKETDAVC